MNKKNVRNEMKQLLKRISKEEYEMLSCQIREKLFDLPSIQEGKTIALTISKFPEVDTYSIIEELWAKGKKIVAPVCNHATRGMIFYELTSFNHLRKAGLGLLEPDPNESRQVLVNDIDCCIVPGIVFDKKGYRIGYGGGYYDRFLTEYKGITISLLFEHQLIDKVPAESHDLPVDILVTNNHIIFTKDGDFIHEKHD